MEVYIILICFNVLDYNVAVFKNFLVRAAGKALGMKSRPRASSRMSSSRRREEASRVCDKRHATSECLHDGPAWDGGLQVLVN